MTNTIIESIKLPKEVADELVRDLKKKGTAYIIGIGRFSVTKFSKKMPLIPDKRGKKVRMILSKNKEFSRIGFKPAISFKESIG